MSCGSVVKGYCLHMRSYGLWDRIPLGCWYNGNTWRTERNIVGSNLTRGNRKEVAWIVNVNKYEECFALKHASKSAFNFSMHFKIANSTYVCTYFNVLFNLPNVGTSLSLKWILLIINIGLMPENKCVINFRCIILKIVFIFYLYFLEKHLTLISKEKLQRKMQRFV
jgi:hypothetical protein